MLYGNNDNDIKNVIEEGDDNGDYLNRGEVKITFRLIFCKWKFIQPNFFNRKCFKWMSLKKFPT